MYSILALFVLAGFEIAFGLLCQPRFLCFNRAADHEKGCE